MPDATGFGIAWKIAVDAVPDDKGSAWGRPAGFGGGTQSGDADQDGDPSMHGFQGSFWGGDQCKYPGCGQPQDAHPDRD